jgi:hypothetical protein
MTPKALTRFSASSDDLPANLTRLRTRTMIIVGGILARWYRS